MRWPRNSSQLMAPSQEISQYYNWSSRNYAFKEDDSRIVRSTGYYIVYN